MLRVRRSELAKRATVDLHPTASVGRVHVTGWGARGSITLGRRSVIEDGAILQVSNGGRIEIGDDVLVRTGAVLNVSGRLELRGSNLVSWHTVVHCAEHVVFEEMAGTGDGVTVVDSTHYHGAAGASDEHWYHNGRPAPIVIGRNTWLAAKSTLGAGVTLGARTTVAAHAVVRPGVYPDGATLAGVPARILDRNEQKDHE